jgi:hypothetical protein
MQDQHITAKGNAFQMAWCLQCHRAPERYLSWNKDLAKENPGATPRELAFKFYWKLQTKGKGALTQRETMLANGAFDGTDHKDEVEDGKAIVKRLGIKTQQLADCSVCHR